MPNLSVANPTPARTDATGAPDPLRMFSEGRIDARTAREMAGLRDHATLLVAMGEADLPLPRLSSEAARDQANAFAQVWAAP